MLKSNIDELARYGQSIWLDSISRSMIKTGRLQELINAGLRGMTSNPTIFEKAISSSSDYDEQIKELLHRGKSTFEIYDDITVTDVQNAADIFKPVYEKTGGLDGYVSLEVNPKLAFQTEETIREARRLHKKVGRPNVMFKVPATDAGFPAAEELLAEGININITLIFSIEQYVKTAHAYLNGIKRLSEKKGPLKNIASVASVFVSRIDTAVDSLIDEKVSGDKDITHKIAPLKGRAAVANSKMIFQKYLEMFSGKEFLDLRNKGANVQRVLWGSTGTKNPDYSDIKYVTGLIGKPTVNTLPMNTLEAFQDHGECREALTLDVKDSEQLINTLNESGINLNAVCAKLLDDGVLAFEKSFDSLLNTIENKKA